MQAILVILWDFDGGVLQTTANTAAASVVAIILMYLITMIGDWPQRIIRKRKWIEK